jgi:hypothetical protein
MANNDQIILDQILEQQRIQRSPSASKSNFFETFVAEQVLKDADLSNEEVESGLVGDGGDGGIDGIYMPHWLNKVVDLPIADTKNLRELAKIAGGDPAIFYKGIELQDLDRSVFVAIEREQLLHLLDHPLSFLGSNSLRFRTRR